MYIPESWAKNPTDFHSIEFLSIIYRICRTSHSLQSPIFHSTFEWYRALHFSRTLCYMLRHTSRRTVYRIPMETKSERSFICAIGRLVWNGTNYCEEFHFIHETILGHLTCFQIEQILLRIIHEEILSHHFTELENISAIIRSDYWFRFQVTIRKTNTFSHKIWSSIACIAFHARNNHPIRWPIEENYRLAQRPIYHAQNSRRSHPDDFVVRICFWKGSYSICCDCWLKTEWNYVQFEMGYSIYHTFSWILHFLIQMRIDVEWTVDWFGSIQFSFTSARRGK